MPRDIIDYLEEGRDRGFSDEELRDDLLDNEFHEEDIEKAFVKLDGDSFEQGGSGGGSLKESSYGNKQHFEGIKKRSPVLVLVFSLITAMIYYIVWLVKTTSELRKNTDSAPNPKWLWVLVLPFLGGILSIISLLGGSFFVILAYVFYGLSGVAMIYYYIKYSVAIEKLSGFNKIGLAVLWIVFWPAAIVVSQIQLNKFADKKF